MGYDIKMISSKFRIKSSNFAEAMRVMKELPEEHYAYVDDNYRQYGTLPAILDGWGWIAMIDKESGDIIDIALQGGDGELFGYSKLGDEYTLFSTIAPFVESGSYIEVMGEDRDIRWEFENNKLEVTESDYKGIED